MDITKNLFTMKVVKYWNKLPREVVDIPCLSLFKGHLDNALINILLVIPEMVRQLDSMASVGPFQLNCSIVV